MLAVIVLLEIDFFDCISKYTKKEIIILIFVILHITQL